METVMRPSRKSMKTVLKSIATKIWFPIRNSIVTRRHAKVAVFWEQEIKNYFEKEDIDRVNLMPIKQFDKPILWQYWDENLPHQDLPAIVQRCFDSVDKYATEYDVIRLHNGNVSKYVTLPDFIWKGDGESKFPVVFFSDLLRLALLHTYGGVWLDATVLLTKPLTKEYLSLDHFVFQRDPDEPNKAFWEGPHTAYWSWNPGYRVKMLNSIIFAKKDSVLIQAMLSLMLHYWKTQNKIIDYFFFQVLYDELVNGKLSHVKPSIVSDILPHILRVLVYGDQYSISQKELFKRVGMHKLTYIDREKIARLDQYISMAEEMILNKK